MLAANIGGFFCKSFGTQLLTRVLVSIFGCPPLGMGSAVVTELFFSHERAQKMGWWTLLITLGIPGGPLVFGFVVVHLGIDWIFGILAIINAVQFPVETLYVRSSAPAHVQPTKRFEIRRLDKTPLTFYSFIAPLTLLARVEVWVPAVAYALVFTYANTACSIELPKYFEELFHFNAQQIGLQYICIIIGSALGEQLSGPMSDWFMIRYRRRVGRTHPTHRLWIAYIGFITSVVGIIVWGHELAKAREVSKIDAPRS
jgi:MFS family permease